MLMKEDKGQTKIGKYLSTTHNKVRLKRPIIHDLSHSFVKKDNCRYRYSKNVDTCSYGISMSMLRSYLNNFSQENGIKMPLYLKNKQMQRFQRKRTPLRSRKNVRLTIQSVLKYPTSTSKHFRIDSDSMISSYYSINHDLRGEYVRVDELLEKITNDLSEITKLGYRKIIGELMCMFDEQGHRWLPKLLLPNCPESDMLVPAKCRYIADITTIKERVHALLDKEAHREDIILRKLGELAYSFENLLISKKQLELARITSDIEAKLQVQKGEILKSELNRGLKPYLQFEVCKDHKYNFMDDLKRIEDHYGPIKCVSNTLRRRFDDLTTTYLRLQGQL